MHSPLPSALLQDQARALEMIVCGEALHAVLAELCRMVERATKGGVAAIMLVDASGRTLVESVAPSLPDSYAAAANGVPIDPELATCPRAAAIGELVITSDIASDPRWDTLRHVPLALGLVAAWSIPILSSEQRVLGTFGMYFTDRRSPTEDERSLIEFLAGTAALAIERDRHDRVLRHQRARLDFAVRLSGVGFWYSDLPFGELTWDAVVKEHFHLPPSARVTIDTFYAQIHGDDREPTRQAIEASIRGHTTYDVTYRTVDPASGAMKWIRALGGAAYDNHGVPVRFDGVTIDVTAHKRDELQLREQDRRKDEFIATLAHELRNPLAPIRIGLELVQGNVDEAYRVRTCAMMERQLQHLVRLVDDLLDLSRVTLGKITLERRPHELRRLLETAIETTRPFVEGRQHELVVQLPSRPLPLEVDGTRLSQAFANLINNAAKFTPDRGRITIKAELVDEAVRVHVIDTGMGIPTDMLPYVFDMFMQLHASKDSSQGGLGIGLTLVKRIVEMHDGTVHAASRGEGHGSTFTLTLPLAPHAAAAVALPIEEATGTGLRVLVVDDNIDAAETLAMMLELGGNMTRVAHTGPDALVQAGAFQPEVVFLDIGLPGLDGYQVARRLREDASNAQATLVAVTGWGTAEDRARAFDAGFDHHLVKPVDSRAVGNVLHAVRAR